MKLPTLRILHQGKPIINIDNVYVVKQGKEFLALEIDMHSKWCQIGSVCGCNGDLGFVLIATNRSTNLKKDMKDTWTEVVLEGFSLENWDIFTAECCRYTLRLVIIKQNLD
jgi:hypothetical protein